MARYDVSFFNNLVNDQGKCCKVLQRSVRVESACNAEDAACQAQRLFQELECVQDWRLHAAEIEVSMTPQHD
jgi:hypothetical protein